MTNLEILTVIVFTEHLDSKIWKHLFALKQQLNNMKLLFLIKRKNNKMLRLLNWFKLLRIS